MNLLSVIIILSILGFINAYALHWQYTRFVKTKKKMFCLLGENCADVIGSRFGATLGVKNEIWGMLYYLGTTFLIIVAFSFSSFIIVSRLLIFLSALLAALFSVYLFFIQSNVLKSWCSWCLIAIGINIAMFIFAMQLFT